MDVCVREEIPPSLPTYGHDFSHRCHAAPQLGGHLTELTQVPSRHLHHTVVEGRLEACGLLLLRDCCTGCTVSPARIGSNRVDTPLSCNSSRRDCSSDNYSAADSSIDCNSNSFN